MEFKRDQVRAIETLLTEDHMCWGHECGMSVGEHVAQTGTGLKEHMQNDHKSYGYSSAYDHAAMHQLGGPRTSNVAHEVTKPFNVQAYTGATTPSNVWYGRSQMLNKTHTAVAASKGDQIHHLHGGDFLVKKSGKVHEIESGVPMSMSHPFGNGTGQKIPTDRVKTIPYVSHGKYR